ncbi:hypothetical protein AMJ44_00165 [candidate division WOR-1 bacterium DG_54_3]|uniref:Uncharacterized protein n=1 Tax=candidate division WOR-1 bacterium DG_54_3 TaxID=1703775 RepID=A0A0S7Y7U0_UNCSA|nr:MAG: hypothetical protein AMJ44_00165 [candidate division WOR-1 bacterium DG_54_3]
MSFLEVIISKSVIRIDFWECLRSVQIFNAILQIGDGSIFSKQKNKKIEPSPFQNHPHFLYSPFF